MNKGLNTLFKIVFGAIIVFGEEYLFYITLLCNVITKESSYMRLAFVFGSLVISVVNITIVYFLTRNSEFKLRNIALLIVSSVIASIGLLILSILFDKNILMEVDYKKEIDYFTILVLSSLITIWTSIFVLLLKILSKIKH